MEYAVDYLMWLVALHIEDCEGWWFRVSWLSGRALAAQAKGVLGLTPGGCRPFSLSSIFAS